MGVALKQTFRNFSIIDETTILVADRLSVFLCFSSDQGLPKKKPRKDAHGRSAIGFDPETVQIGLT